jgi:hypothetical protein
MKILLGQLSSNGDCAYATILARQLRYDYPKAHLTWAVSSPCAALIKNNPHIDKIWEVPVQGWNRNAMMWRLFEREAIRRYLRREFDEILLSQIWPNNVVNFDGTVRPSILRSLGRPITVPVENVIRLTETEIDRVETFVRKNEIDKFEHRILFECEARSGQSFVTPDLAQEVAKEIYAHLPNATVIYTTAQPMKLRDKRSRHAGELTLREVAHLTRSCSLFVGAGSGCTVVATSTAAKALPSVILLKAETSVFASFAHDFEYFGIDHPGIVEMSDENPKKIAACVVLVSREGCGPAQIEFGDRRPVAFGHYGILVQKNLLRRQRYLEAARSLMVTAERYGWTEDLLRFGEEKIAPNLTFDPSWFFADNRAFADRFRATLVDAARAPAPEPVQISAREQGLVASAEQPSQPATRTVADG